MNRLAELEHRLSAIEIVASNSFGVGDLESLLVDLLLYVRKCPIQQKLLEARFITLFLTGSPGSVEVLEFLMRDLQWEAIRNELQRIQDSHNDFRVINEAKRVLEVFEAEWANEDIYRYYSEGS